MRKFTVINTYIFSKHLQRAVNMIHYLISAYLQVKISWCYDKSHQLWTFKNTTISFNDKEQLDYFYILIQYMSLCKSYPHIMIQPLTVTDDMLKSMLKLFKRHRLPTVIWRNQRFIQIGYFLVSFTPIRIALVLLSCYLFIISICQ